MNAVRFTLLALKFKSLDFTGQSRQVPGAES